MLLVCKFIMPELYVLSGGHLLSVSHPISYFAASFGTTVPFWARNCFIDLLMVERGLKMSVFTSAECSSLIHNGMKCFLKQKSYSAKGQLITKANFHAVNSSKKRTNEFVFTTMQCVFFVLWKKLKTPKRHFNINWPLSNIILIVSRFMASLCVLRRKSWELSHVIFLKLSKK